MARARALSHDSSKRQKWLYKRFQAIVSGETPISPGNAKQFLEAIAQNPKPEACFTAIMTGPSGASALLDALKYDLSIPFFNKHIPPLVRSLQDKDLATTNNGVLFSDIVTKLSCRDMDLFWMEFRRAFLARQLDDHGNLSFGWLYWKTRFLTTTGWQTDTDITAIVDRLTSSSIEEIQHIGREIQKVLLILQQTPATDDPSWESAPGGRHDNDHPDFRKISILPTHSEIEYESMSSLRRATFLDDPATEHDRVALHLDNQFRLLREDMLSEMKEEFHIAMGKKKGYHRGIKIKGLVLKELDCGPQGKRDKWGLVCVCGKNSLPELSAETVAERKTYLEHKPQYLKHQSLTCLIADKKIIGFASINRDEQRLAKSPPEIVLQFEDAESIKKALHNFKLQKEITLIQINTAVFAFEPILKGLQQARTLALSDELLSWKKDETQEGEVDVQAGSVVRALRSDPSENLKPILGTPSDIKLDSSQASSLVCGLTRKVSLIQGPPGTGKSFIGTLVAKAIHDFTSLTILVVCFTNHALDDILEGLMDIGIPPTSMVRMGGKSTLRTEPLSIAKQPRGNRSRGEWTYIEELRNQVERLLTTLNGKVSSFVSSSIRSEDILAFLEFWDGDLDYFDAFQVPDSEDGFKVVGSDGKEINPGYLLERWAQCEDAGVFKDSDAFQSEAWKSVWAISPANRKELMHQWKDALLKEDIDEIYDAALAYNQCHHRLLQALRSDNASILRSKRIVGCTTTAAAKYREEIQSFNPDVLLVEEAGEILESHVLMSLGPETSQIILIGDHKQLRPKVNNYQLTVEKGDGFDLNRSLFERLILRGYPHVTLSQQHRMRPEISDLIRRLTYPELVDAPKTQNRPDIRGICDNIIFIHHDQPEDEFKKLADRRDMASTGSKQNSYEANMVWKIVRYLGQQGYGTSELVVLTPYLGQLYKLRDILKSENDPILNDLDAHELIQAGLLDPTGPRPRKKAIRLATIDNYQGEESDIVIVSLTRSNPRRDIGFMYAPERLNVLLSRARNGLIILGNADTFRNARKGQELWQNLFEMLEKGRHVYQGLPARCEQHPDKTTVLSKPGEFDDHCPDGGCLLPCGGILACGVHGCPKRCHRQKDHSNIKCTEKMRHKCPSGHTMVYQCSQGPPSTCRNCEREKKLAKEKQERDLADQQRRDQEQRAHQEAMDKLNAEIDGERKRRRDDASRLERAEALEQRQQDLENLKNQQIPPRTPDNRGPSPPARQSLRLNPAAVPPVSGNSIPTVGNNSLPATAPPASGNSMPSVGNDSNPTSPGILSKLWSSMSNFASSAGGSDPASQPSSGKPFKKLSPSPSKQDWENQKALQGTTNAAIDAIMQMTGLEEVKKQILDILAKIETAERQNISLKRERFHVSFLGNPGTGKTTVARQYAKFLASVNAVPGDRFEETTGASLANKGVDAAQKLLDDVTNSGGVIFIDEAYQLTSGNNFGGGAVLDYLLAEMENRVGKVVFIFAGYDKEMEKFFQHNPGLKSRVPYEFHFSDYKDEELMDMFGGMIDRTYGGRMKVEGGVEGLYGRILIRRLGRRRGRPGFGNARDLENILSKIRERQASRLKSERKTGFRPDDFLFMAEDMIGPDPSAAILQSNAYQSLNKMIGLKAVKNAVASLISITSENYRRELSEKEPVDLSLNRVFLGSPGTGKTTVAKLYGQILADIGLLSNGEVVVKNPADFVGAVIGASEANTKAILANSVGKVLIIDEAYMLYGGGGKDNAGGGQVNQYKTSVIDTIVAEVQNTPGEDRCVLLLGYKDQMLEMFQNVNPGLSRRFKIEDAFNFEDFTDDELLLILDKKLKEQDLSATDPARTTAIEVLSRMRNRPNFGNAGEVENSITRAKTRALERRNQMSPSELANQVDIVFIPEDFDPDCNRAQNAASNLAKLFEDVVGHQAIIERLRNYQQIAQTCKARGIDPKDQVPMNFIFTGPPGTGKTTIARKVGQVFYDMGLLSSGEVVECSASDLVGQFVGQTGPKTRALFERALGKVLFIDEAYRLSQGHFAQEAIDEVVGLLTHPTFKGKLVIVLAGYEQDMNNLMSVNTGLASRFPHQVVFPNMSAEECLKVIEKELKKKNVEVDGWSDESSDFMIETKELIRDLAELPDWGNARDMVTLAKEMISTALLESNNANDQSQPNLKLSSPTALDLLKKMIDDRHRRAKIPKKPPVTNALPVQSQDQDIQPPSLGTSTDTSHAPPANPPQTHSYRGRGGNRGRGQAQRGRGGRNFTNEPTTSSSQALPPQPREDGGQNKKVERDPGVPDDVWRALTATKREAEAREKQARREIAAVRDRAAAQRRKEEEERRKLRELERQAAEARLEEARKAEIERQKAEARRKMLAAQEAKRRALEEARAREEAERKRKEKEERVQQKLRQMGVCVAGFQWINMGSYYLCAGGSHTVSLSQLGEV